MKKIFPITAFVALFMALLACNKPVSEPQKEKENPQNQIILKAIPKAPIGLGSTLTQVEEAEQNLGSTLLDKQAAAGFVVLKYKTTDEKMPLRTYLVKEQENNLLIVGLYTLPNEAVWKEENILHQEIIDLFEKEGYIYNCRVDQDNQHHHYFLKPTDTKKASEYIEYLVEQENKEGIVYTTFSVRITDSVYLP